MRYYRFDQQAKSYFWAVETITTQGESTVIKEAAGEIIETGYDSYNRPISDMRKTIEFSYTAIDPAQATLLKPVVDYLQMVEGKSERNNYKIYLPLIFK